MTDEWQVLDECGFISRLQMDEAVGHARAVLASDAAVEQGCTITSKLCGHWRVAFYAAARNAMSAAYFPTPTSEDRMAIGASVHLTARGPACELVPSRRGIPTKSEVLGATTGSTSASSYVRWSASDLEARDRAVASSLHLDASDVVAATLDFATGHGLNIYGACASVGAKLALQPHDQVRPTVTTGTATSLAAHQADFSWQALRLVGMGSEVTPPRLAAALMGVFPRAAQGIYLFGSTEAGLVMTGEIEEPVRYSPPRFVDWRLADDGELLIYEPPFQGYLGSDELEVIDRACGWWGSRDAFTEAQGGALAFEGRTDRRIKRANRLLSLDAVERWVEARLNARVAVTSLDGEIYVYVEGRVDTIDLATSIQREFLVVPSRVVGVQQLPYSGGKIDYAGLHRLRDVNE